MIDQKDFSEIRDELSEFEKKRETVIASSRDVIHLSKLVIYSVLRDDMPKAESLSSDMKGKVKLIPEGDYDTGMRDVALQEYVEALALLYFVKDNKIPTRGDLDVDTNNYLMGLCDFVGELVRLAVNKVVEKDYAYALKVKSVVEDLYGEFLQFDLRNGPLRKKADSLRWNLKKLEEIALDISTRV